MRFRNHIILFILLCLLCVLGSCHPTQEIPVFKSEEVNFKLRKIADSIRVPFGMDFLPGGDILVTNRFSGELIRVEIQTGHKTVLTGVPKSYSRGDGGALDILLHPNFENNKWLYFSHSIGDSTSSSMAIDRARLKGDSLVGIQRIFTAFPFYRSPSHYGSRMALKKGHLYFTMGDRYDLMDSSQTLGNHLGKVMRILEDGRIPGDNPFLGRPGTKPELWSYGHRNPQGLTLHPETGQLWIHEHGPKGGDELNLVKPGLNYGWPVICHGIDYDDTPIGAGITHKEGMEQPVHFYTPSIAPSGMEFYTGDKFKAWKGNLFIGAMALTHLNRLVLENGRVVHEERILQDFGKRIRVVRQAPDGLIYIGVDGGAIYRLEPL
ncbi:PQQ-dependent sugar dehydrogenase [Flagellimonas flava]|uniref:Glucose/arabinose dehydrogenase, beta-propeller fold n=1 Tax=Flagellimonas flava TaxID=570519 RepID=A0A1M5Q686_9FLAO|nr:PQQ-dependent sugar dehydrogenase [Allomuricauda flava]SHH09410.1 Glucose/arabinose dehydrogenase, beta-propeller fold [Allomuricauda flava]